VAKAPPWSVEELRKRRLTLLRQALAGRPCVLRTWIEYGFKHAKNELGWADYRVTDYATKNIPRHGVMDPPRLRYRCKVVASDSDALVEQASDEP